MSVVVHWVNQFAVPPDQPGGTRHFDMSAELQRRGVDARIVASDLNLVTRTYSRRRGGGSLRAVHECIEGVPFTFLTAGSYSGNDWRRVASMVVFALAAFAHLLRAEVRRGSTVFIGSSPSLFAAVATWAAARLRRVPFVVEIRDLWPESYTAMTGRDRGVFVRVMRLLADHLYRRADAVVVLAPDNADHVLGRGAKAGHVHVIPNGVDVTAFDDAGDDDPGDAAASATDLSTPGRFTFVYAGAHGPANGLDVVVDACRLLAERGDDSVTVALVGDGPAKAELQARAAGLANVRFHDPVAKAAVPATLRSADVGLMVLAPVDLFRSGVSPNKLFDYLACDLPVITNVPGWVASIVADAEAGAVVPPGDVTVLADAMTEMARDASTFAGRGRAYVAAHFDRRVLAGRLADVIDGLVD